MRCGERHDLHVDQRRLENRGANARLTDRCVLAFCIDHPECAGEFEVRAGFCDLRKIRDCVNAEKYEIEAAAKRCCGVTASSF